MYKRQQSQLGDLEDTGGFSSESKSWFSGDAQPPLSRTLSSLSAAAATASAAGSVDRDLFNDLVEMVPLVQSLIDRKANSSFTRRGSMICTKMPSRESLYKKTTRSAIQAKRLKDEQNKASDSNHDGYIDNISIFSSRSLPSEKESEDLLALRDQVEDLKRQVSEKDEILKSAECFQSEMSSIQKKFEELKNEAAEKDSLIKSIQLQLTNAKVTLADKQAAIEKLQWAALTSENTEDKLQQELAAVEGDISCFMLLIEGCAKNGHPISGGDYDVVPYPLAENIGLDSMKEVEMHKLEEAREAYIAAVAIAKEKQDEDSIAVASSARFLLQSFILKQT